MHKHKHFRPRPRHFHRGGRFGGMFWLILIAFMFLGGKGNWWPGILILIGAAFVFSTLFRNEHPHEPPPPPPFDMPPPPPARRADTPPNEPMRRSDLLPATCPNCGGPVRSNDLKWTSSHSVACSYCGSNIETRKA